MRYELYVQRLPRLAPEDLAERTEDLPRGLSVGTLEKALREKQVPFTAIGWSDERQAIDAIAQRLTRLGAQCEVRDHASLFKRVTSALFRSRKQQAKPAIRFKKRTRRPRRDVTGELLDKLLPNSPGAARALRAVLLWVGGAIARWVVVGALYVAYAVGLEDTPLAREPLELPLAAVAVGVLSAQTLTSSAGAMVAGKLHVALAVPPIVASLASLVFAMGQHQVRIDTRELRPTLAAEQAAVEAAAKPPAELKPMPRYPFEGLMEELRLRKMKGEVPELSVVEAQPTEAELEQLPGAKMAKLAPATPAEPTTEGDALAPQQAAATEPSQEVAVEPEAASTDAPAPHEKPAPRTHDDVVAGEEPWPVYFGLSQPASMALLVGSWALALALGVALVMALRRKGAALAPAQDTGPAPEAEPAVDPAALQQAQQEAEALRAQLEEAATARKQAESKLTAIEALSSGQVGDLSAQLEAARSELEATRAQLELLSSAPAVEAAVKPPPAAAPPAKPSAPANANAVPAPRRAPAEPAASAGHDRPRGAVEKVEPRKKRARTTYTLADVEEERVSLKKERE